MDAADEAGYTAWNEYYNQMYLRHGTSLPHKTYWNGRFHKAFRTIGELCVTNKFNVVDYIRTTLNYIMKDHQYITPRDLTLGSIVTEYKNRLAKEGTTEHQSWINQIMEITATGGRLIPKVYPDLEALLLNPNMPFYSWFKVLYLTPFSERLFQLYGKDAWQQLQGDKRLRLYLRVQASSNIVELEKRLGYFDDAITGERYE